MYKTTLILVFIVAKVALIAQSGFQIGIGTGIMILNNESNVSPINDGLKDFRIKGKTPYYIELKADFAFSNSFEIRSGAQWRWRSISIFNGQNEIKTNFSIPLMFNYRVPLNSKRHIKIGINAGISVDNFISNSSEAQYSFESNNSIITVKSIDNIYNGSFLSFNGSLRFGIEIEKDYNLKGRLGLQILYIKQRGNRSSIITELKKDVYKIDEPSQIDYTVREKLQYNDLQSGFQIGLFYYFGEFNINKKNTLDVKGI